MNLTSEVLEKNEKFCIFLLSISEGRVQRSSPQSPSSHRAGMVIAILKVIIDDSAAPATVVSDT